MAKTYTVKWGDTLSEIALANNTTVNALVKLNGISNPDYIVVGQVIKLDGESVTKQVTETPKFTAFGLRSGSDRTVYAVWSWSKAGTEKYEVEWQYYKDGRWWTESANVTHPIKESLYTPSESTATAVRVQVKAVVKSGNSTKRYTSERKTYYYKDNPPKPPSEPNVTIDGVNLTARLSNLGDLNASIIEFNIAKGTSTSYKKVKVRINSTQEAVLSCTVDVDGEYKVRCRSIKNDDPSNWSVWTDSYYTIPAAPSEITKCTVGADETSIVLQWSKVKTATSYDVQYTSVKTDFDKNTSPSDELKTINDVTSNAYTITGVEQGKEYFVRVRSVNSKVSGDNKTSDWTPHRSTAVGTLSAAPTTMSSSTTAVVGEPITLYWLHNSEDGSSPTYADLDLYVGGVREAAPSFDYTDETGATETNEWKSYVIDTSGYEDGAIIQWRVRTAGVTKEMGEWSTLKSIEIYAEPTLDMSIADTNGSIYVPSVDGDAIVFTLESLPFGIVALAGPDRQSAINYHITVTANESYETTDDIGNRDFVSEGEAVYSKYFDTIESDDANSFSLIISAGDLNLDSGISYTVTCTASMDSGLSAEASIPFVVQWTDVSYTVDADVDIDEDSYTATIRPYCLNEDGTQNENTTLFVYRREFDGSFTLLGGNIASGTDTFVPDPHPALDYARYRVVAMDTSTGAISYSNIPSVKVGAKAAIIQWDEQWTTFDSVGDVEEEPAWSGSMLKLPYNIDVSDKNTIDVELVEYIGRSYPVSYYGTQLGVSSSWNVEIPKDDRETLYALRRLSKWLGDVYVREPSGSGYWANVKVSFNQRHRSLTIPVTIAISRVEGGA